MELKSNNGFVGNRSVASPSRAKAFEAFRNDLTDDWAKAERNTEELNDDWLIEVSANGSYIEDVRMTMSRGLDDDDFEDYPYNAAA
jgi:hypothetical protein